MSSTASNGINVYITSDTVNIQTGGGLVTGQEFKALSELGPISLHQGSPTNNKDDVWWHDSVLSTKFIGIRPQIAHFYAGTFSKTVAYMKSGGTKVTYTAAAHDIQESKQEHESLGIHYNYPHLTEPSLWRKYLQGYLDSDVLIVPSRHSRDVMRRYGRTGRIETLPHGVHLPQHIEPLPQGFTVGYLGSYGPDKGVRYLLEAWKKLNHSDATLLLGGRDSNSPFVSQMIHHFGGGNIRQVGWVDNVSDFYNQCNLYIQPSVSEGFGCEVLEAMAHARPVLCSTGAGASDCVPDGWTFLPRDVKELAEKIDCARSVLKNLSHQDWHLHWRNRASNFTWDKIREQYIQIWRNL